MSNWIYILIAVCAGMVLPLQAGINSSLAKHLGSAPQAGVISFLGGLLMMIVFCVLKGQNFIAPKLLAQTPPHLLIGGFLGGTMVITAIILAPKIGAVSLVASLVAGQLIFSVIIDHHGWVGFPVHSINPMRLLGVGLLISGLIVIQRF